MHSLIHTHARSQILEQDQEILATASFPLAPHFYRVHMLFVVSFNAQRKNIVYIFTINIVRSGLSFRGKSSERARARQGSVSNSFSFAKCKFNAEVPCQLVQSVHCVGFRSACQKNINHVESLHRSNKSINHVILVCCSAHSIYTAHTIIMEYGRKMQQSIYILCYEIGCWRAVCTPNCGWLNDESVKYYLTNTKAFIWRKFSSSNLHANFENSLKKTTWNTHISDGLKQFRWNSLPLIVSVLHSFCFFFVLKRINFFAIWIRTHEVRTPENHRNEGVCASVNKSKMNATQTKIEKELFGRHFSKNKSQTATKPNTHASRTHSVYIYIYMYISECTQVH